VLVARREKPAVLVVTAEFERLAAELAKQSGHPDLRTLVLPYPLETRPDEEVTAIAADAFPRLVRLLGVRG
jgi:hypothetical protein